MEYKTISQLRLGDVAYGFYFIKAIECKTASNNKKYFDLILSDKTGTINAKIWDVSEGDEHRYYAGVVVKVKGIITEWQNQLQCRIEKIRLTAGTDGINIEDFIPMAPCQPELMYEEILKYVSRIKNRDVFEIVSRILNDSKDKLMFYPAAKKNHHSIRSGLLYHIMTMLKSGEKLSEIYTFINTDLLYAGIILHDIAKLDEMDANELGIVTDYTIEGNLLGHIVQGIKKIAFAAEEIGADEEISLLLQHMILSHHYEPEYGSPTRPQIPEAELLHYIDIIDTRMFDIEKALENIGKGDFSQRIWVLDNRRLYKAK
ncbi:MAG: 3'-5' exoribonuclease YhaM [Pelotomaculum sp. PtaU1.Bin065]|nr:MAG: 3'-5' exoribonuclease YhaM [Pelotomaculum sp. PtaU1.Bin065]